MPQFFDKMRLGVRNHKLLTEKLRNIKSTAKISFYKAKMTTEAHNILRWV